MKRQYFWFVWSALFILPLQVVSQNTHANANGATQGNQASSSEEAKAGQLPADVPLSVDCVIEDKSGGSDQEHICTTTSHEELGHHLKLHINNLKKWLDAKHSPQELTLFINGREITKNYPVSVNPEREELVFKLEKTADSEKTWDDLIIRGKNWTRKGIARKVRASVGYAGGTEVETKAELKLNFLPIQWAIVCVAFSLGTLAGLVQLCKKSSLIKDYPEGPFSLARTQMAIWSWLLVCSYFFLFVMWWDPQVPIPPSILGLLGISASTYVAAVLVDRTDPNAPRAASKGFFKDICGVGDEGVQLHRVQIIAWTVVLTFVYIMHTLTKLSIPDFNPTLLGLLGMSAGTYVGFKFPENQALAAAQLQPQPAQAPAP